MMYKPKPIAEYASLLSSCENLFGEASYKYGRLSRQRKVEKSVKRAAPPSLESEIGQLEYEGPGGEKWTAGWSAGKRLFRAPVPVRMGGAGKKARNTFRSIGDALEAGAFLLLTMSGKVGKSVKRAAPRNLESDIGKLEYQGPWGAKNGRSAGLLGSDSSAHLFQFGWAGRGERLGALFDQSGNLWRMALFFFGSRFPVVNFLYLFPFMRPFIRSFVHSFVRSCYLSPSFPSIPPCHFPKIHPFLHFCTTLFFFGSRFPSYTSSIFSLRASLPSPLRSFLRSFVLSFPFIPIHTSMSFSQNSPILTFLYCLISKHT